MVSGEVGVAIIDYQQRIIECSRQAGSAPNEEARKLWRQMEEFWRQKAFRPRQTMRTFKELDLIGSPLARVRTVTHDLESSASSPTSEGYDWQNHKS